LKKIQAQRIGVGYGATMEIILGTLIFAIRRMHKQKKFMEDLLLFVAKGDNMSIFIVKN
jgi:hypothetical protein